MNRSGYQPGSTGSSTGSGGPEPDGGMGHEALKKQYLSYLSGKSEEIKEQQRARRYQHNSHWTADQIAALNKRRQPVLTFNLGARKINGIVGHISTRMRADPKAFPRTQGHEKGAELATATLRYVMDDQRWAERDPECAGYAAVDGLAGIELTLEPGDSGDPNDHDVGFEPVDPSGYFYDPRSMRPDFSDKRFEGIGKWADVDVVVEMFPDKETEIRGSLESGSDLTSNPDSDVKWLDGEEGARKVRLVDHWYIVRGEWHYCVYTGSVKLMDGVSPFRDEKRKTISKFIMFSAFVDQDGDRYGFWRGMRGAQDEVNSRRSKGLHISNSRRMVIRDGEGLDVEKVRTEAARPDGVIVVPPNAEMPVFDDGARAADLAGQLKFLDEAKAFIENFAFNPSLIGTGVQDMSGRAIQLQQQAGIAELGPFILAYKGWKLRVYRAIWCAIRDHWTAERAIRVTDDDDAPLLLAVNQTGVDPRTGLPAIINRLGALDVDIILDEGPDTMTMAQSNEETLQALNRSGTPVPPEIILELSSLDPSVKAKIGKKMAAAAQPPPAQQKALEIELRGRAATNAETEASARLKQAQTVKTMAEAQHVGGDAEDRAMDLEHERWDALRADAKSRADAAVDQLMASYKLEGQRLTNVGKTLDIQRQREAPPPAAPPQPGA